MTNHTDSQISPNVGESLPSPFLLANMLLRNRRLILGVVMAGTVFVVVTTLLAPPSYTTSASFISMSTEPSIGRVRDLAAQFGISGAGANEASPPFYADLVRTREVLEPLLLERYDIVEGSKSRSATLLQLYELADLTSAKQVERGLAILRKQVSAAAQLRTGVVSVTVRTQWPEVSEQVARLILAGVDEFNVSKRRSQAAVHRDFALERLSSEKDELREAEDKLMGFLQSNRNFRNSPALTFQQDRLASQVAMKQQLVTSLTQSYEQARIDATRDTPVLTIVEYPHRAVEPDRRRLVTKVLLALIGGFVVGVLLSTLRAMLHRARREDPSSYAAFESLQEATRADIRRFSFGLWPR